MSTDNPLPLADYAKESNKRTPADTLRAPQDPKRVSADEFNKHPLIGTRQTIRLDIAGQMKLRPGTWYRTGIVIKMEGKNAVLLRMGSGSRYGIPITFLEGQEQPSPGDRDAAAGNQVGINRLPGAADSRDTHPVSSAGHPVPTEGAS